MKYSLLILIALIFTSCETAGEDLQGEGAKKNTNSSSGTMQDEPKEEENAIQTNENNSSSTQNTPIAEQPSIISTSKYNYLPKIINDKIAINFLSIASFGANEKNKLSLKTNGIEKWVDNQFALPYIPRMHLRRTIELAKKVTPLEYPQSVDSFLADNDILFNKKNVDTSRYQMSAWFSTIIKDEDELRHKMAYALSQIIVESSTDPAFRFRAEALATYFDILTKNAFGNYRDLLIDISHSSSMGVFLTYQGNKKEHTIENAVIYPDENYARELMQLFTIGLSELNMDGSSVLDSKGNLIASYTQKDVNEIAKVFTGWDLRKNSFYGRLSKKGGDFTHPLEFTQEYHDTSSKVVLGKTIPSGNSGSDDIKAVIDILMAHKNIAPFISKQLIMRLTKSNPTPQYIERVANVFNDNGHGVKGDLKATLKAILLDKEIWENDEVLKFKEPLVAYIQFLKAFNVQAFPIWGIDKTSDIHIKDTFFFNDATFYLGQAPARAFSVFNFYSNSYIPSNKSFQDAKLVAPELQIQTDSVLIAFSNKVTQTLLRSDKRHLMNKYGTIDNIEVLRRKKFNVVFYKGADKILLDFTPEYNVIEKELEGEVDGVFKSFGNTKRGDDELIGGLTKRDKALQALISHLDIKLTGGLLSDNEKKVLFDFYKNVFYYKAINKAGNPESKIYQTIIAPIVIHIVTSEIFMVQ